MPSDLFVEICKIESIIPHGNANRLELAIVKGWQCTVPKGKYQKGDKVIYIPIDAMIPYEMSEEMGITKYLSNPKKDGEGKVIASRVRTSKQRGVISQGVVMDVPDSSWKIGRDVKEDLNITKYEPPARRGSFKPGFYVNDGRKLPPWRLRTIPGFDKYTHIQNFKNFPHLIEEGEEIIITEKVHGCLSFDDVITLYDGSTKKIGYIIKNKLNINTLGLDKKGNLIESKILNWYNNGMSNNWKKVKFTRDGLLGNHYGSLIITDNHEFYNPDNNLYIKCSDLKNNDNILLCRNKRFINYLQKQILIGKMIGDGSLANNSIEFNHKKDHEEYIDYTLKLLGDIAGNKQKEQISGYGTLMCRARTISDLSISEIFNDWFIYGNKEIPLQINLSPISIAFWYMDCGSLSHNEKQEDRISFATCRYNEESVDNLIDTLKSMGITSVKFFDGKYWRIRVNSDEADKIFILIKPYIPKCMQYKLPERYKTNYDPIYTDSKSSYKPYLMKQKILSVEDYIPQRKFQKVRYDLETETNNYFANGVLVHNSNFRSARLEVPISFFPFKEKTILLLKKFLSKISFGSYEFNNLRFLVGSHDCNLRSVSREQNYELMNVYWKMAIMEKLEKKLRSDEEIFGEIYGQGVQKLLYDSPNGIRVKYFDMKIKVENGFMKYLDWDDFVERCQEESLSTVPVLYRGPFKKDILVKLSQGNSTFGNHIREGVVVKPVKERIDNRLGRVILKYINDEYLLIKNKSDDKLAKEGKEAESDIFDH